MSKLTRSTVVACGLVLALLLGSCARQIPSADQFQVPAAGLPVPAGFEGSFTPDLPPGQSGALIINQTGLSIQVAVSNTIATLPANQSFFFSLPSGTYEFFIYEPDSAPRVHSEKLEDGKLRYLYISRLAPPNK